MIHLNLKVVRPSKFFLAILMVIGLIIGSCMKEMNSCYAPNNYTKRIYKTENVFIIVMDGLRYSEGWGDSTHQNIPRMAEILSPQGVIYTHFYNKGRTYTSAGHTSLTTGVYQAMNDLFEGR